jgi:hypothetical protein
MVRSYKGLPHLRVSEGEESKCQFTGAGYNTKNGVLHFMFNEDAPCPTAMNEEQSVSYIVRVILV